MRRARIEAGRQLERLFRVGAVGGFTDAQLLEQFLAGDEEAAEAAFEAIVGRHGPMVLRTCRTVLRDAHAAEDAFQATFLVLARKARTLGERELLGNWLYGVATRTARKARTSAARRRARDREIADQRFAAIDDRPPADDVRDELGRIVHEEISRLPGPYRAAVVVCYLEGMTQEQAARQFHLAESTVRGRLARARKLLGHRLTRRGVSLAAGPLTLGSADAAAIVRLPMATVRSVARLARLFGKPGQATGGAVSATAQSLARGVLSTMCLPSLKTVAAALIAFVFTAVGTVVMIQRTAKARSQIEAAEIAASQPGPGFAAALVPSPAPTAPRSQDAGTGQPKSTKNNEPKPTQAVRVDPELAKRAPGPIVRSVLVSKDCMILSYMPDWDHGDVDNIGIGNADGGNRTLIDWPEISADATASPDRQFLIAIYARKTISNPPAGRIHAFPILENWPERSSWRVQPRYDPEPFATYQFEPGEGWKLFDITPLVRARAKEGRHGHGILLRFLSEDFRATQTKETLSTYFFVSREGTGEWANRRPLLLVVKATNARNAPAR